MELCSRVVVLFDGLGHLSYDLPVRMPCWDHDVGDLSFRGLRKDLFVTEVVAIVLGIVNFLLHLNDSHVLCLLEASLNFAFRHPQSVSKLLLFNDLSVRVRIRIRLILFRCKI